MKRFLTVFLSFFTDNCGILCFALSPPGEGGLPHGVGEMSAQPTEGDGSRQEFLKSFLRFTIDKRFRRLRAATEGAAFGNRPPFGKGRLPHGVGEMSAQPTEGGRVSKTDRKLFILSSHNNSR